MNINKILISLTFVALYCCTPEWTIKLADFKSVRPGMKVSEIQKALRRPGTILKDGEFLEGGLIAGPGEQIVYWKNKNGSNMSVSVRENAVTSAAQWNLH